MENGNFEFVSDLRTVISRLIKKLRKESATGSQLSLTERSVLFLLLQNGAMLPSELAATEKITNQSMSTILGHLLQLGYITRTPSLIDKRKVHIKLTPTGEETLLRVRSERDQWLATAIAQTCTKEEQALLKQVIGPLTKLVDFV